MFKEYQTGGTTGPQNYQPLEMLAQNYGLSFEELMAMSNKERASFMGERYGISDPSLLHPELFGGVNQNLLGQLESGSFDPLVSGAQTPLINELLANQSKMRGTGLAGSYAPEAQMSGLYDVYGKGMGNIFGQISQQKQTAQTKIADIISGYGTTASGLRG